VLLLGHMRSGSSLLLHLLLTNPEVAAVGERNAVYRSRADLARLAIAARRAHRPRLRRLRYVADQINHNRFTPNPLLLQDPRVRVLFILRQPEAAIASLLAMSRAYYDDSWSVSRAADYYVERLAALRMLGSSIASTRRAGLISYETLTERADQTLEALRSFLQLQQPFSQTYPLHAFTQVRGDPGPVILAGRIMPSKPGTPIELPAAERERVRRAHADCESELARFALSPGV
jgi:hypothetical protein